MKLFIWEGNGISGAYHDDGTLVVLAETVEQARKIVRTERDRREEWERKNQERRLHWYQVEETQWLKDHGCIYGYEFWKTPLGEELHKIRAQFDYPGEDLLPDGEDSALDLEPTRIVEIDEPKIVAFNGGGYD